MKKILISLLCILPLFSEEGLWPLNQVPREEIFKEYGVDIDEAWTQSAQNSCLRVSAGGSASFVSPHGLVMTNHHVGSQAIYGCSSEEKDLIQDGFYAKQLEDELKCPNLYMDQLVAIRDVTSEVNAEVTSGMSLDEKEEKRKEAIAEIKKKAHEETSLHPEVVKLYQGARYHLYFYKRYNDIRLVMAPEIGIASFGGEIENFEFPRHDLDVAFFRVYEEGKPLNNLNYFRWSTEGPMHDEPLFVLGHPGRTERLFTFDHLCFHRDHTYPMLMEFINGRMEFFETFSSKGKEQARIASHDKGRYSNAKKAYAALALGLNGDTILFNKEIQEKALLLKLSPEEREVWKTLASSLEDAKDYYSDYFYLEGSGSNYCKLYVWAHQLLRLAEEKKKPNALRLKEYVETEIPTLEQSIAADEPIYLEYEREFMSYSLDQMKKVLGESHPAVQAISEEDWISGTELHDPAVRKKYLEHPELIEESKDPLIALARTLDPYAREAREKMTNGMIAATNESYAKIVPLIFEKRGESMYPDATFTLRLSVGCLKGYFEGDQYILPTSKFGEAYIKDINHYHQEPFALPKKWLERRSLIDESTPFNFVSTHDIIGGNSGSPVINTKQEIVGLIFDGNAHSLTWDFEYNDRKGRAVSVHSRGILHALDKIYQADRLVKELCE